MNKLDGNWFRFLTSAPACSSASTSAWTRWDPETWPSLLLQEAATRSAAASRWALRRSCCWTGAAWPETPPGTPAATRAPRTWRTVMTAWVARERCRSLLRPVLPHPFTPATRLQLLSTLQHSKPPTFTSLALLEQNKRLLLSSHSLPVLRLFISKHFYFSSSHVPLLPLFPHHRLSLFYFSVHSWELPSFYEQNIWWDNLLLLHD